MCHIKHKMKAKMPRYNETGHINHRLFWPALWLLIATNMALLVQLGTVLAR
jgi:hypothetical protein